MKDWINRTARKLPTWPLYIMGAIYPAWLFWLALNGGLGIDPVKGLEHAMGEKALQLLILGLAITPLRKHIGLNLLKFRRSIGLIAFFYVFAHLLVWLVLDVQIISQIWADIVKRPYITIGMVGFVLLIPLAVTSNNWSIKKLGPAWRKLHRLTYGVCLLGGLHFVMLAKGFQLEPLLYMATVILLLSSRIKWPKPGYVRKRA